jgi:hypothetical protein
LRSDWEQHSLLLELFGNGGFGVVVVVAAAAADAVRRYETKELGHADFSISSSAVVVVAVAPHETIPKSHCCYCEMTQRTHPHAFEVGRRRRGRTDASSFAYCGEQTGLF